MMWTHYLNTTITYLHPPTSNCCLVLLTSTFFLSPNFFILKRTGDVVCISIRNLRQYLQHLILFQKRQIRSISKHQALAGMEYQKQSSFRHESGSIAIGSERRTGQNKATLSISSGVPISPADPTFHNCSRFELLTKPFSIKGISIHEVQRALHTNSIFLTVNWFTWNTKVIADIS